MSETNFNRNCQRGCWIIGGTVGLITALIMLFLRDNSFLWSLVVGLILAVAVALLLNYLLCRPLPKLEQADAPSAARSGARSGDGGAGAQGGQMTGAAATGARSGKPADSDIEAETAEPPAIGSAAATDERARSATEMPDEVPPIGAAASTEQRAQTATDMPEDVPAIGAAASTEQRASAATEMPGEVPPIGAGAAAEERASAAAGAEGGPPPIGAAAATESAVSATASHHEEDYDRDGIVEGKNEGTEPPTLDGPRGGQADNLKEIKGIGPKLEKMLNGKGIYHFDQVAEWSDQELAWVDANIEGFKGRASRDQWVSQAKVLAAGGETEFSKRVDDGDVY